jgi:hypothetical protein
MNRFGIGQLLIGALVSVTGITTATSSGAPQETTERSERPKSTPEDATLAVINDKGEHIGSAVSFRVEGGSHWAVTNQHVVSGHSSVCLSTRSGESYPFGVVILPRDKKHHKELDIAFLRAPTETTTGLAIARLREMEPGEGLKLPLVVATGFPTSTQIRGQKPRLNRSRGLLVPLLESELEEGYDTTYTASIEKGMSGGGVFIDEELIAVNGVHSDPLWDFHWRDKYGKRVNPSLNEKLELVSIGISLNTILREFKRIQSRSAANRSIVCSKQRTAGTS